MTDSPYAIPFEELLDSARVPLSAQVVEQPERRLVSGDTSDQALAWGDGMPVDAACD